MKQQYAMLVKLIPLAAYRQTDYFNNHSVNTLKHTSWTRMLLSSIFSPSATRWSKTLSMYRLGEHQPTSYIWNCTHTRARSSGQETNIKLYRVFKVIWWNYTVIMCNMFQQTKFQALLSDKQKCLCHKKLHQINYNKSISVLKHPSQAYTWIQQSH